MAIKQVGQQWTKSHATKSVAWFFLHFIIYLILAALFIVGDKLADLGTVMKEQGGNYLYAVICTALLILITYFYFFFENRKILTSGKSISMIFMIIDAYLILACSIGYNFHVYARPIALAALLTYMLVNRRDAIFMNVICAMLVFVLDTFGVPDLSNQECYSSLIIAFSAGMISIFCCGNTRTRFSVVLIGLFIVVPIDLIVFILEAQTTSARRKIS